MNIHRLSLGKWLLRAIFGALSAGGDTTGGSSSNAETDNPDEEPHPPLDEMKAKCVLAWAKCPIKPGTRPFKSKLWQYFYPCEDFSSVEEGDTLDPYDGYVKSIFLPDDQPPLSRMGGVQKLENSLIGKVNTLGSYKPKISLKSKGFRTSLSEEFVKLTKSVQRERDETLAGKRKRAANKKAFKYGATMSSNAAYTDMKAAPSATAKRAKAKQAKAVGSMDKYVVKSFAHTVNEWSDRIAHDQARLFFGCNFPDRTADSPLFHQFVKTVLEAGQAGATLPPIEEEEEEKTPHIKLLTSHKLGGAVLDDHAKLYHDRVRRKEHDIKCGTKVWGFSATSDGTDRIGKGVMNLVILYKDGTTTFLKLHDSSGNVKDAAYVTKLMVSWFVAEDFPLDPMDLILIIMDGGERSSFDLIEKTFQEHVKLPSVMCVWCASHSFNLLLKAFGNIDGINELIEDVKFVINYVRNHSIPRSILRELSRLSMLVWCITRFGTIFICMDRLLKLENALRKLVLHEKWDVFYKKQYGDAKDKAIRFRNLVEDRSFFAKMKKTVKLTEPVYAHLRICDSDVYNTIGVLYDFWLKIQGTVASWERTKFSKVDGVVAFRQRECSLVGNEMHDDTGKNAGHGFTASEMVIFRWTKMADAGNTGTAHVLGRWLNPACIEEDFSYDNQLQLARQGLEHYFPKDPSMVRKIWTQHKIYMALDKKGPLFYNANGKKRQTCDLDGPDRGCSGADWWFQLDYPYDTELSDLRAFAMRFLGQKAQESAAERHYSLVGEVQSDNRGRMQPKSAEKRCLFKAEVLQEIAEYAGNATNNGLKTVDEAAAMDEAEMATPDALD